MIQAPPPLLVETAFQEPWHAARRLAQRDGIPVPGLMFLDSAMAHKQLGRWSYVMAEPFGRFRVEKGVPLWNGNREDGTPLEALRRRLETYAQPRLPIEAAFQGGAAGYLAYEAGRLFDRFPTAQAEPDEGPEIDLGFYDVVLAVDLVARRAFIMSTGWPEAEPTSRLRRARERLDDVMARLSAPLAPLGTAPATQDWTSNFDAGRYRTAVAKVIDYIRAGDIFQANFTQAFRAAIGDHDPLALYDRLRHVNPATFAALIVNEDRTIASSSPERFVRLRGAEVETRPIKGTVPRLCGLETYANVHHLVSVVSGELREGVDGLDLIAAAFPGGSITGAPKIRAMEIIRELEGQPRGVYCGSIGYIGFDGAMDFNIAIRTVTVEKGEASFGVGGGITTLSDPAAEHAESLTKAERLFRAFTRQDP